MLVVKRKEGERIKIGENIEIVIFGTKRGSASVGITAPPELIISRIDRQENGDGNDTDSGK
jgi:carbon storage regulator CsrA